MLLVAKTRKDGVLPHLFLFFLWRGIVDAVGTEVRKYAFLWPRRLSGDHQQSTSTSIEGLHNAVGSVGSDESDAMQNNKQV